jgi:hypothetical protein
VFPLALIVLINIARLQNSTHATDFAAIKNLPLAMIITTL